MDSDSNGDNNDSVIIEISNDLDNEILEEVDKNEVPVKQKKKEVLEEDTDYDENEEIVDINCLICMEMMTPPMLLGCGHNLCVRCWRKTASVIDGLRDFNRNDKYTQLLDVVECPQCRQSFDIEEWMMAGLDCSKHRYIKDSMGRVEYYNACHRAFGFAAINPFDVPFGVGNNSASWFNFIRETIPQHPLPPPPPPQRPHVSEDNESDELVNDGSSDDDDVDAGDDIVERDANDEDDLGIALNQRRKGRKRKSKHRVSYNWFQSCYRGFSMWLERSIFVTVDHLEKLVRFMFLVCMVVVPFLFAGITLSCLIGVVYVVHKLVSNPNGGLFIETWSGMASLAEIVVLLAMSVFFGFYSLQFFADLFAKWKDVRERMLKKLAQQNVIYLPTTIANNNANNFHEQEEAEGEEDILQGPVNGGNFPRTMNNQPQYVAVGYAGANPMRRGAYYGRGR